MAELAQSTEAERQPLKSIRHDEQTYVTFKCRCRRKVSVYWHNYQGKLVRYCVLNYGKGFDIDTYVTHPWSARDWLTGDRLLLAGKAVYFPRPWTEESVNREVVCVDIPVYTLKERCEQVLRSMLPEGITDIKQLDLPQTLARDLRNVPIFNFSKYSNQYYEQNSDDDDDDDYPEEQNGDEGDEEEGDN